MTVRSLTVLTAIVLSSMALTQCVPSQATRRDMLGDASGRTTPERPRYTVDTREPALAGKRVDVPAGSDLQSALDSARPGDTIVLAAGATYTGPFRLRKRDGDGWIVITTSAADRIPRYGSRIHPSHAPLLPKLRARAGVVIEAEPGAHHYRFTGVEVAPAEASFLHALIQLGGNETRVSRMPHHIVFDRCYVHGDPRVGARRGIALNTRSAAVIGSYFSDFKEVGADSQAIAGWNGTGPFRIANNYLEAAGENVMFGGADPAVDGLVPADIEVSQNHMAKPLRWKKDHATFEGTAWTVKNLFELKNARRVVIEGNLFEYNWVEAQNGIAILFTVRNQDGGAPWSTVEDVVFAGNLVRHAGGVVNILGRDDVHPSGPAQRIAITNNLFEDIGGQWGAGRLFQLLDGTRHITIDRNTASHTGSMVIGGDNAPHVGFVFTRNVLPHNQYGIIGSGTGPGTPSLDRYFPGAVIRGNVIVGGDPALYPRDNYFPKSADGARAVASGAGADVREIAEMARRVASATRTREAPAAAERHASAWFAAGLLSPVDPEPALLVFFAALFLLFHVYVGYPALAWLRARLWPRRRQTAPIEPSVSIVLVAYNEADRIEARVENLLSLDYPHDRLEILIGSDGSTDATVSRASRFDNTGIVNVTPFAERRGKPAVLNELVARATGDIVVFADARQRFDGAALRALVTPFADAEVGAVSGELVLRRGVDSSTVGRGAGFYWKYEKFIRSAESRSGSTLCATGAIYAIRRTLFEPLPPDTILDDVLIPARIIRRGYAVLFEPDAIAFDDAPMTPAQEHVRKVRTSAGNFQLLSRERWLLDPRRNPLWLATVSHKALRLTLPVLHVALFWGNLLLIDRMFFRIALAGQLAFYAAAVAAPALRRAGRRPLPIAVPYAVCLMMGAAVVGFIRFATKSQRVTWERVRASVRAPAYAGTERRTAPRA